MTDFISRDALRVSSLYGYEYVSLAEVRAAPPIRCRTCRWMRYDESWLCACEESACFDCYVGDPDHFGCTCWEACDD